jgi:hypothetical protein
MGRNIIHKITYRVEGNLVGDDDMKISFQFQNNIYYVHRIEAKLPA